MGVSKVQMADGTVLMDITDSTINENNMLSGVIGYNAAGKRVTGKGTFLNLYATTATEKLVTLSSDSWVGDSASEYTQRVAVSGVTSSDTPVAEVYLSADADAARDEMFQFSLITSITCYDGYVIARCLGEKPDIELIVRLLVVDTSSPVTCKTVRVSVPVSGWEMNSDGIYTQQIPADVTAADKSICEVELPLEIQDAYNRMEQYGMITAVETYRGFILLKCHRDVPDTDLSIKLMILNIT